MTRALQYQLPIVPRVFYYVTGRKCWDKRIPAMIRASWKIGAYGGIRVHNPRPKGMRRKRGEQRA